MTAGTTGLNEAERFDSGMWERAKQELAQTMTQATFNTWLVDAKLLKSDNAGITIGLKSQAAVDWVESRLQDIVGRVVASVAGQNLPVEFAVRDLPYPNGSHEMPTPEAVERTRFQESGSLLDALHRGDYGGFVILPDYVNIFWKSLLGMEAFAAWETLAAFCFKTKGLRRDPTLEELLILLGVTRHKLLGRAPSGSHPGQVGLVEGLEKEGMVRHRVEGATRAAVHHFAAVPRLPFLTPAQVKLLPEKVQQMHHDYLKAYFDAEQMTWWESLTVSTLVESPEFTEDSARLGVK